MLLVLLMVGICGVLAQNDDTAQRANRPAAIWASGPLEVIAAFPGPVDPNRAKALIGQSISYFDFIEPEQGCNAAIGSAGLALPGFWTDGWRIVLSVCCKSSAFNWRTQGERSRSRLILIRGWGDMSCRWASLEASRGLKTATGIGGLIRSLRSRMGMEPGCGGSRRGAAGKGLVALTRSGNDQAPDEGLAAARRMPGTACATGPVGAQHATEAARGNGDRSTGIDRLDRGSHPGRGPGRAGGREGAGRASPSRADGGIEGRAAVLEFHSQDRSKTAGRLSSRRHTAWPGTRPTGC